MIQLETRSIAELVIDPRNAMLHPEDNLEAIRASLTDFGQVEPLVVQRGTNRVIAGNGRLAVMRSLGWQECSVVALDIDDMKAIVLGLALNQTAKLARWDAARVLELVGEIEAQAPHMAKTTGFSESELHKFTNIAAKEERLALEAAQAATATIDREKEEVPKRIMCADCPFRHG